MIPIVASQNEQCHVLTALFPEVFFQIPCILRMVSVTLSSFQLRQKHMMDEATDLKQSIVAM